MGQDGAVQGPDKAPPQGPAPLLLPIHALLLNLCPRDDVSFFHPPSFDLLSYTASQPTLLQSSLEFFGGVQVKGVVLEKQTARQCPNRPLLAQLLSMLSEPQVGSADNRNATALNYAREVVLPCLPRSLLNLSCALVVMTVSSLLCLLRLLVTLS